MMARQVAKTPKVLVSNNLANGVVRRRFDGAGQADPGVVHQHVDRAECGDAVGDCLVDAVAVGHVERQQFQPR